ncbi:Cadherin EGF LAG seven-pass G-type receptor 3 [Desmophyllum pertusum]|uniref:Cadherin EGF LAG seven-pass G-type receptor 3 n=1 Tax=Desmophyllum pertusum TaxID=174260 RepID=A0A9X0CWF5_9CNID|nr:Cadherin EGF LAG seven-pass G-type receptor 3 [Desmophyllum pertusum]
METTSVVDNMKSTPVLADILPSHIMSVVSSSPVVSKHVGDVTVKSSFSEHIPDLGRLTPSPSSSLLKPALMTTTPTIPVLSTSAVLGSATASSIQINRKASPPLQPTRVKSNVTTASPTVIILNASVTATAPPTMHEPPIIVKFEEQRIVGLNAVVQVKCAATGNPPPKVRMTVNTQPAEDADGVTVTSHFSETEIELKVVRDSEVYCEATNERGRQKRKMKISVQQTGANYMILKVKLPNEEFDENMKNKDSKQFQDMAKRIISQVLSVLGSLLDSLVLAKGSVKADILIKTFQDTDDSVEKKLKAEVENAKLGNLAVDRYLYSVEQSRACPSVFENVTWNDAVYGDIDVQPCPRGAKGFAKRNCSLAGDWYYPDYTNCKSDDFDSLRIR